MLSSRNFTKESEKIQNFHKISDSFWKISICNALKRFLKVFSYSIENSTQKLVKIPKFLEIVGFFVSLWGFFTDFWGTF